jgi:hypothetical protein
VVRDPEAVGLNVGFGSFAHYGLKEKRDANADVEAAGVNRGFGSFLHYGLKEKKREADAELLA